MNKAVFLDRDGVINELIFNEKTGEFEPPHLAEELKLYDFSIKALKKISEKGFKLFLISNQPDYAKGKADLENIQAVHEELHNILIFHGIVFEKYFYCYHHPEGIHPGYAKECDCRKPKPFFILNAINEFNLDKKNIWIVGDRDTDILCGLNAGIKTILIKNKLSANYQGRVKPDFTANDLKEASDIIINFKH
jgi:D-glycero-D-manno-heptose 1,7-bisphosphate phosphatase